MTEPNKPRRVHADELRELGFPETVIQETAHAEERGLFRLEPSPDLVQRTIARCQALLKQVAPSPRQPALEPAIAGFANAYQKANARLATALDDMSIAVGDHADLTELSRINRLPVDCLATVNFARAKRQRPLMIVDNHNLFDPSWWDFDSGFLAIRRACRIVNAIARESGVPPVAVVMVLRPDIKKYSDKDIAAISKVLFSASSDVWMCPYGLAGEYKNQDVIVIGENRVLTLETKVSSPGEALGAFQEIEDASIASAVRGGIEQVTTRCVQVRSNDALIGTAQVIESIEIARSLIKETIMRGAG
jgi:hypothetical protein